MRVHRNILPVVLAGLAALALVAACGTENTPVVENVAAEKARYWLEVIDSDTLRAAYDLASAELKDRRARDDWIHDVDQAREPYGEAVERTLARATMATEITGYPADEHAPPAARADG